jgi:lysozyme family protein
MADNFTTAFQFTLGAEGGFTKDPTDKGNWTGGAVGAGELKGTKYGISAASYPDLDIANLTLDQAMAIYRSSYWDKLQGDKLPLAVARVAFDTAVNSGVGETAILLQRIVGTYVDGDIGDKSVAAINKADPVPLAQELLVQRVLLDSQASQWQIDKVGWVRRAIALACLIT